LIGETWNGFDAIVAFRKEIWFLLILEIKFLLYSNVR
jgi:hypothetical protein